MRTDEFGQYKKMVSHIVVTGNQPISTGKVLSVDQLIPILRRMPGE
jgi:hypothetical protein